MLGILEKISPSELVSNGYISNHNKVWRPRPKFKVSFYLYFCCFWINVTQINFENIKRIIQRIISDSCFQLKLWFNVDARAPSIPLLNFPFKLLCRLWTASDKPAGLVWDHESGSQADHATGGWDALQADVQHRRGLQLQDGKKPQGQEHLKIPDKLLIGWGEPT